MATDKDLGEYLIRGFVNGLENLSENLDESDNKSGWGKDNYYYCRCGGKTDLFRSDRIVDYFPVESARFYIKCPVCGLLNAVKR